jgi:hypothetical protein
LSTGKKVTVDLNHSRRLAGGLLLLALAFNFYYLWPEASQAAPRLNDSVLHGQALQGTLAAPVCGPQPHRFLVAHHRPGVSLFHNYQHLGYLPPALLSLSLGGALPCPACITLCHLLLGVLASGRLWSMRRLGFRAPAGRLAGLVASLLATNGLLGFEFGSYIWRGSGLYTQLWGMVWMPPAPGSWGFIPCAPGEDMPSHTLLLAGWCCWDTW